MARPTPRKWYPKNPRKYDGDANNIICRSSWEVKVCVWLDTAVNVISWKSEEIVVPYMSPVDQRYHRYFVDFFCKIKSKDGTIKNYLIEVKPYKQTQEPAIKKKITKQYITEVTTWAVNQAKFKAATEYCKDRGWEFKILTEMDLFGKK